VERLRLLTLIQPLTRNHTVTLVCVFKGFRPYSLPCCDWTGTCRYFAGYFNDTGLLSRFDHTKLISEVRVTIADRYGRESFKLLVLPDSGLVIVLKFYCNCDYHHLPANFLNLHCAIDADSLCRMHWRF